MSFLSKLFGGSKSAPANAPEPEIYKGFRIFADPMKDGSQYRIAARIELDADGATKTHQMIRADTLGSQQAAAEASLAKAKALIDQQGDRIF